jgi:hypothetical protein
MTGLAWLGALVAVALVFFRLGFVIGCQRGRVHDELELRRRWAVECEGRIGPYREAMRQWERTTGCKSPEAYLKWANWILSKSCDCGRHPGING